MKGRIQVIRSLCVMTDGDLAATSDATRADVRAALQMALTNGDLPENGEILQSVEHPSSYATWYHSSVAAPNVEIK